MTLKKTFCSSPWFHLRLTYDGSFEKCRWLKDAEHIHNIKDMSLIDYHNSEEMDSFRFAFLNGKAPTECGTCYYQEEFNKLSGRQKQLLKSAIQIKDFNNGLLSSPHFRDFAYSHHSFGCTMHKPTDLQVDLGNLCNSACIMCEPRASSRLSQDYQKLSKQFKIFSEPVNYTSWVDNETAFNSFLDSLSKIPDLKYIHLLGGETLYNRAFYKICNHLIEKDYSKDVIVGTTTNGTLYTDELENIIPQFKEFHLGISIESITTLNDYVRYPSDINEVLLNIQKFIKLRESYPGLYLTLRITPNLFTIYELDSLLEFSIVNKITVEACNILHKPECLRMELIPDDIRAEVIKKLEKVIEKYSLERHSVANIRSIHMIDKVTADAVFEYLDFIKNFKAPDNLDQLYSELVEFLKGFESIRNNSIVDYAPRYKNFLRSIGY